jgi:DNA-directed RNA polymerase subunit E'/Rpb7
MSSKNTNKSTKKLKDNMDNTDNTDNMDDKGNQISNDKVKSSNNMNKVVSSNLHNPYKKTIISTPIMILPYQLDNKIYIHLKSNLKNKLENKCYENYGYIDKIYNIEEISDGVIEPEDPSCSVKMDVKFSCNLFLPIIGKEIICKIDRMNKALIMGINGPIKVIITVDKINKDNFFPDINRNIRVKGTSEIVVPNMYIRVLVISKSFSNYDTNIIVIGFLQDMATQKEIEEYIEKTDDTELEINNLLEN